MKVRTLIVLSFVALLVVPGLSLAAVTGSPSLSVHFADDRVTPGEETTVSLVVVNEGDLDSGSATNPSLNDEVTTARGLTVNVNSGGAPVSVLTGRQAVGTMPEGASEPITFNVAVDEDADPDTYRMPVPVSYKHTSYISEGDGARDEDSVSRTLRAGLTVEDGATLDVVDIESGARVGSTGTVAVTVENTGSITANDTRLTMTSQSSDAVFGETNEATKHVGTWEPGEQKTVRYRVTTTENAEAGNYSFGLEGTYAEENGRTRTTNDETVGVDVEPEQRFSVVSTESDVAVGESGDYTVTLRNEGPVDVSDAAVEVASQNSAVTFGEAASTSRFAGNWAVGENQTVTVDASVAGSADTRSYSLATTVTYQDPEGDDGASKSMSVGLEPAAEQSFSLGQVDSSLAVGDDGQLSGTVTNEGDRPVRDVVLTWASEQQNVNPSETEYAVGNLGPGESAEFAFDVEVSEGARSGPRQFSLVADYETVDGDARSSDSLNVRQEVAPESDEFDVEIRNATVSAGGSANVGLTITNTRDEPLTDISAALFADSPISTADDEAYVQRLEPGESAPLVFSISASGGALEKQYPMSMDFQYDEPDGDTVTSDTYKIPVQVEQSDGGNGVPVTLIGGALLVALVGVGAFMRFR